MIKQTKRKTYACGFKDLPDTRTNELWFMSKDYLLLRHSSHSHFPWAPFHSAPPRSACAPFPLNVIVCMSHFTSFSSNIYAIIYSLNISINTVPCRHLHNSVRAFITLRDRERAEKTHFCHFFHWWRNVFSYFSQTASRLEPSESQKGRKICQVCIFGRCVCTVDFHLSRFSFVISSTHVVFRSHFSCFDSSRLTKLINFAEHLMFCLPEKHFLRKDPFLS